MSRKKKRQRKQSRKAVQPKKAAPPVGLKQDWSRSGAHNIAGVSFQVAVTANLLLEGRADNLPLTSATPEGVEDIDVEFSDGTWAIVQVKDRSPTKVFAQSDFTEALTKRSTTLEANGGLHFVLATNATLGGGLCATGWNQPLSQCLAGDQVERLSALLEGDFNDPHGLLGRVHIVQVEQGLVEASRRDFARILDIHPSVATLAYARLIERITEVSVSQRHAKPETFEWIAISDLDTLATQVIEVVDVDSLEEAVHAGIVEPIDFSVRADMSRTEFLAGVDVLPAHVAAGLDLPRPTELDALTAALEKHHSALLTGPSGAGKSALVWRTARELAGCVRPYRLLRLLSEDVPTLSRWIRRQEPSKSFPLLVCADNLGRPQTAGWPEIAREFIDRPGVLLLGACREEDFRPELAVGRTTVVDPKLDRSLATSIAATLADSQPTVLDVGEAFEASTGLLMEFLSMLLTGRRLQQVVEEQVAARLTEERATEREILRYVATAHAAGVPLPADVLSNLIPGRDLTPALSLLHREHILIADDESRWQGLHELRSMIARDYLHQFPPPTAATTIRHLVEHLPARDASRIIESYARQDADLIPAAEVISEILDSQDVSADDGAQLVSSLAMADAFRHARECLRVVEDMRPERIDPETALLFAYVHRFAGVSLDSLKDVSPGFSYLTEMAAALPPRPESLRDLSLRALPSETIRDIAKRGTPDEGIRWLESLEGSVASRAVPAQELWAHFDVSRLEVAAPLTATLRALEVDKGATPVEEVFGDFSDRMRRLADDLPDCVEVDSQEEADGRVITLSLLVPDDDESLNDRSVQACRLALDLCPEADIAEVIVVTPEGDRHATDDFEPGHKRIPRDNLPRPAVIAPNDKFIRAARLLLASRYWTEPLRILAECSRRLIELRDDSVAWLINPHHNRKRRRAAAQLTDKLIARLASGPREPASDDGGKDRSSAREALSDALSVVRDVAVAESPDDSEKRRLGTRCRSAVRRLRIARHGNLPNLSTVGDPLPEPLDLMLQLLADVLLAAAERQGPSLGALRKHKSESWVEVARRFVDVAASGGYQTEQEALKQALNAVAASFEIRQIKHSDTDSVRFLTDWWVVLVSVEDNTLTDGNDPTSPSFIDHLATDTRDQLACRTFIVLGVDRHLLPTYALKLGVSQLWPADDNELSMIASGLGKEVLESMHLKSWDAFVAELVGASRAAALLRMRRQSGFALDEESFNARCESSRRAAAECDPLLRAEAYRLLDRVKQEPHNPQPTLASEVYRLLTFAEVSDDLASITTLRNVALSIDL